MRTNYMYAHANDPDGGGVSNFLSIGFHDNSPESSLEILSQTGSQCGIREFVYDMEIQAAIGSRIPMSFVYDGQASSAFQVSFRDTSSAVSSGEGLWVGVLQDKVYTTMSELQAGATASGLYTVQPAGHPQRTIKYDATDQKALLRLAEEIAEP